MDDPRYLVSITGPTASGKTDLAIALARHYHTDIISADSRQFYKEIRIGTARPDDEQMAQAKHHFVAFLSIHDEYNAGRFENEVLQVLEQLFRNNKIVIMAGGSGLFVQAVLEGFDDLPAADPATREKLEHLLEEKGIEHLQGMLKELDPAHYQRIDLQNPHRLMRALEVCLVTGKPYSEQLRQHKKERNFIPIKIGLNTDRDILYNRINRRVDKMIAEGLVNEARQVFSHRHLPALQTVGYKELFDHFEGEISMERAVDMIKQNTRRFAKRQLTWFRRDPETQWFKPGENENIIKYINTQTSS